jgi:peptide/nickel transport system substrate-binding protein
LNTRKEEVTMKLRYFVVLAMVFLLVGSVFSAPGEARDQVVRVALKASDIRSIDPHYGTTTIDYACIDPMFNALVRFKPGDIDPEKIEPDLAEGWNVSRDGLVWTFYLRRGVKFHKGYGELTAEDVKYSLEKAANKDTSGFAKDFEALDSVEVIDPYTVRLTFTEKIPSVLGILTDYHGGFIVSKKAVEEMGLEKFKTNPIGTGPFMLQEYLPKQKLVEVRHEEYFRGRPLLDKIEFWFMPDASSREMAFRKGEIDICEGEREQAWVDKMGEVPGTIVDVFGPGETLTLHFNTTKKPLDDGRVREALAYAIKRQELMDFLGSDVTEPLVSPIPTSYLGGTTDVPLYSYDPEKAKSLLKDAGLEKGFTLKQVITEMSDYRRPMEQIQEQLRRVGVGLEMDVIAHSAYHQQIRKDVNPIVLYICARFPTADPILTQFYHSESIVGTSTAITNFSHFDQIDGLIEQARGETQTEKQKALWAKAQRTILEEAVAYPLCITKFVFARKDYVDLGYEMKSTLTLVDTIKWNSRVLEE